MKKLREILDKQAPLFEKGGKFEKFHAIYELHDTGLFTPGEVTKTAAHVRDGLDLKRMMITVAVGLVPCILMALYNTGYQIHHAIAEGAKPLDVWQTSVYGLFGFGYDPDSVLACGVHGLLYWLPVFVATMLTGFVVEVTTAVLRKHEVNEGFLVTGFLIPLTLPATIPLWQVVLGTAFGIVFAKEVFGGTGMNFLNPALTARAFLFFAYPGQISGDQVWVAADFAGIDSYSGATWLAQAAVDGGALSQVSWFDAFIGRVPGSMGETSTAACILGALLLIATRIGSWRTMLGIIMGTFTMATLLNMVGSETNPMLALSFKWHVVLGGWAFGTVFMATDPVSSAFTNVGKLYYGFFIGILVVLVRAVNPAYPEGMMLAILFMNMFAPLIDHYVVRANIKRREARYA
ncbi:MAG: NADH:ubiquinone reductase (Na(+)-transporting) subunit B [Myxococcales bacterium]|nr:NADH:ubiquinone reductase (Na(+)-transporting) subunit B [Myxococcales bacterium]MDD9966528.1 NADH:ubiquinone reductase (Na(+)-transporting) subunit B [Myxococcales bacterium]